MRKTALSILLLLPLAACVTKPGKIQDFVATSDEAKVSVPFCSVAKRTWGEPVSGDPIRTKAQKAALNSTGQNLCAWPVNQ